MGVFIVALGHALPPLETAEAPCHSLARLIPFWGVGWEVRGPFRPGMTASIRHAPADGRTVDPPATLPARLSRPIRGPCRLQLSFYGSGGLDKPVRAPLGTSCRPSMGSGTRFRRYAAWCDWSIWARRMQSVQDDPDLSAVMLDSTIVRAHVSVAPVRPC